MHHLFVLLLIVFSASPSAGILFQSNFESEGIYTSESLKPNAKRIELLPHHGIPQWWPENGGQGIIEPNHPKGREKFRYAIRKGNLLLGVRGITKPHGKWVEVKAGGLSEYYRDQRKIRLFSQGKISVSDTEPMFGSYSAKVDCNTEGNAVLESEISFPSDSNSYVQFQARFSVEFMGKPVAGFHLLQSRIGTTSSLMLGLTKLAGDSFASLHLMNTPTGKTLSRKNMVSWQILSDSVYVIETSTEFISEKQVRSRLWINGSHIATCISKHTSSYSQYPHILLGKQTQTPHPGHIWFDRIIVSNSHIGTIPKQPVLSWESPKLVVKTIEDKELDVAAAHWQMAENNSWLLPAFNSGPNQTTLSSFSDFQYAFLPCSTWKGMVFHSQPKIPTGLAHGKPLLARLRQKSNNGHWGPWSLPFEFTPPLASKTEQSASLRVLNAHIASVDGRKPLDRIQREKWYDLHLNFTPLSDVSILDVYFTADIENHLGHYRNRGGEFRIRSNYALSLSFLHKGVWAKENEGQNRSRCLIGRKGLYCDDTKGASVFDRAGGKARVRIKLPNQAQAGTWKLAAFVADVETGVSPFYQRLFFVHGPTLKEPGRPVPETIVILILLLVVLFLLALIWIGFRARRQHSTYAENKFAQQSREQLARQFIQENYTRPISLQDVADAVHVSANWLSKLFKNQTGKNVILYINELRINKALEMLQNTDLMINEICFRVGFNSVANFNVAFKKIVGESPQSYREKAKRQ